MNDYKSSAPTAQLGGAKRKNGHKANCSCHICENMKNKAKRGGYQEDAEKREMKMNGGSKKKNGHKMNCSCPICKNMKNAKKRGGGEDEDSDEEMEMDMDDSNEMDMNDDEDAMDRNDMNMTGGKKSNGHKMNCKCPICKNMKKKTRRGGQEPDIENQLIVSDEDAKLIPASDDEYDELVAAEEGQAGPGFRVGGTRKRRGTRKSNGHKMKCKCPICKNMRGGKKTRRHKKRSHRRR